MRIVTNPGIHCLWLTLALMGGGCGGDDAETDPCQYVACSAGGSCQVVDGKGSCICQAGYTGADCSDCAEGYHPESDGSCVADPSCEDTNPCGNHGTCQDDGGEIVCLCDTGYAGETCNTCADGFVTDDLGLCVPHEACPEPDDCPGHSHCDDSSGSIECVCDPGYQGDDCDSCAPGYHPDESGGCLPDESCPEPDPCGDHGSCDDGGGSPVCVCDQGWAGTSCDRCDEGYHDQGGECLQDTDCHDYLFWDLSYLSALWVSDPGQDEPCCYDYTGDGVIDNALGNLFVTLASVDIDANQMIEDGIQGGDICNLIEYHGMDSAQDDAGFDLPFFRCLDEDENYQDNLGGQESFLVYQDSFVFEQDACTSIPLNRFRDATVTAGHLEAQAEVFSGIYLPPGPVDQLYPHELHLAHLEADLTETQDGVQVLNGKLGGAIPLSSLLDNVNQYAAEACACLGLSGNLVTWEITMDGFDVSCEDTSQSTCDPGSSCATLASYCSMGMGMLPLVADIDLDGDQINDACSVGFEFEAVSAQSGGLTP